MRFTLQKFMNAVKFNQERESITGTQLFIAERNCKLESLIDGHRRPEKEPEVWLPTFILVEF